MLSSTAGNPSRRSAGRTSAGPPGRPHQAPVGALALARPAEGVDPGLGNIVATLLARSTCLFSDIPIVIEPRALRNRLGSPWSSTRQTVDRCSRQL